MSLVRSPAPRDCPADDKLLEGLRQRVRLFELILADLWDARTILRQTLLPVRFLSCIPALRGPRPADRPAAWLRTYAAELIRCPDGAWRVAVDRTCGVGNDPAASLLEAPALASFLPALCRFLLGDSLRLPSLPSLWLADPGAVRQVAVNAHRWIIVDAFRRDGPATRLAEMGPEQRITLQRLVDATPWRFAARLLASEDRAGSTQLLSLLRSAAGAWLEAPAAGFRTAAGVGATVPASATG